MKTWIQNLKMGSLLGEVRQTQNAWYLRNLRVNKKNDALVIVEQREVFLAFDRILQHHVLNLPHVTVVRYEVLVGARWVLKAVSYVIYLFSLPDFFGRITGKAAQDSDQITYTKDLGWSRLRLQQQFCVAFYNIWVKKGKLLKSCRLGTEIKSTKCSAEMEPVRIFSTRPVNFKIIAGWPAGRPVSDRPGQLVFCRRFLFTVQCI